MHDFRNLSSYQACSQESLKACEVLWNKGTLINILSTARKIFLRENLWMLCPKYYYSCILNAKFNPQMGITRATKSGYFLDSWKEQPNLSPLSFPPPVASLVMMSKLSWCNHHYRSVKTIYKFVGKLSRKPGKLELSNNLNRWKNFEVGPWNIKKVISTLPFIHIFMTRKP